METWYCVDGWHGREGNVLYLVRHSIRFSRDFPQMFLVKATISQSAGVSCVIKRNTVVSFFSCDQAALWMVFSVCLSVCLSVRPSHLFDYVPIIVSSWNFQELSHRTRVPSMQKVKVGCQRTQIGRFRTVTPVWIHQWLRNAAQSLK